MVNNLIHDGRTGAVPLRIRERIYSAIGRQTWKVRRPSLGNAEAEVGKGTTCRSLAPFLSMLGYKPSRQQPRVSFKASSFSCKDNFLWSLSDIRASQDAPFFGIRRRFVAYQITSLFTFFKPRI